MAMEQASYSDSGIPQVLQPDQPYEAWRMKQDLGQQAIYISGGTLLRTQWETGLRPIPRFMISLEGIQEMQGIRSTATDVSIGALVTLNECRGNPLVEEQAALLQEAIRSIAAPSIRNIATIGGNVSSLIGDALPALLVLDAELLIYRGDTVHLIPLEDWLRDTKGLHERADLITRIRIPIKAQLDANDTDDSSHAIRGRWISYYQKVGRREAFTPSLVTVALSGCLLSDGTLYNMRLAAGGGAARPSRLRQTEGILNGNPLTLSMLQAVSTNIKKEYVAASDAFASERYRKDAAANLIIAQLWKLLRPVIQEG